MLHRLLPPVVRCSSALRCYYYSMDQEKMERTGFVLTASCKMHLRHKMHDIPGRRGGGYGKKTGAPKDEKRKRRHTAPETEEKKLTKKTGFQHSRASKRKFALKTCASPSVLVCRLKGPFYLGSCAHCRQGTPRRRKRGKGEDLFAF